MLTTNATTQYGQVGWLDLSNGNRYTFIEQKDASNNKYSDLDLAYYSLGSTPYYTVLHQDGKLKYYVDGAFYFERTANLWTPTHAQIMGEIQVFNSQMPGAQTDDLQFTDGHIYVGGSWQTFNGSPLVDPYYSNFRYYGPVAGVDLNIWDHDCLANG